MAIDKDNGWFTLEWLLESPRLMKFNEDIVIETIGKMKNLLELDIKKKQVRLVIKKLPKLEEVPPLIKSTEWRKYNSIYIGHLSE